MQENFVGKILGAPKSWGGEEKECRVVVGFGFFPSSFLLKGIFAHDSNKSKLS